MGAELSITCRICGRVHKDPIRGGKVTRLPDCFKRGHTTRMPKKTSSHHVAGSSIQQRALKGWGQG